MKPSAVSLAVLVCLGASTLVQAQTAPLQDTNQAPLYSENVVSRTTRAVKYEHRSGSTNIDFKGSSLMPDASGEAKVDSKRGALAIDVQFRGLDNPTSFGSEYLTYVLWAISPEGRSVNLGEVLVDNNHRSKLNVTTDLQTFAMIVTAEPYYAVRRPSNVVVAENAIRPDTVGTSEAVDAKYELTDRGGYISTGYHFDPVVLNSKLPLEFFEARNAVRIAKSAGAENYAGDSYKKAVSQMNRADEMGTSKHVDKKALISASREVVQTADDSREIAVKRMDADRVNAAKDAEAAKLADARAQSKYDTQALLAAESATVDANRRREAADQATASANQATAAAQQGQQNALAESDRNRVLTADANQATANANQATADAQQGQRNAVAESDRNRVLTADANQATVNANQATADAQQGQRNAVAESDRNRVLTADANQATVNANQATADAQQGQRNALADSDRNRVLTADANQSAANANQATANANQATADAQQGQRNAEVESERNRLAAVNSESQLAQAVQDREELRAKLLKQFNLIFVTRDTARGLIVNLSDVLFDTGKSTLRPEAREKLAKISGIVLAYPDLRLAIEGNTDSVGTDALNQTLSAQRANSVRDYLVKENIPAASMTSQGFGKSQPVASNDTAEGRQQNRRVELVVSGDVIGTTIGAVSLNVPLDSRR